MKKVKTLLASFLCIAVLIGFSGCGKKKDSISADEFCDKLESKNFTIADSAASYVSYDEIEESYIAISPNYEYQIEFIVFDSDSSAESSFATNKNRFESESSSTTSSTSVSLANYSKYTLLSNGKYKVVSRIDNTLIYLNIDADYKDEVESILNEIGY